MFYIYIYIYIYCKKCEIVIIVSYRNYNKNVPQHLSKEEYLLYKIYVKIKILFQKPDKGNSGVIVDKIDYLDEMENLLNDGRKFEKINFKE